MCVYTYYSNLLDVVLRVVVLERLEQPPSRKRRGGGD